MEGFIKFVILVAFSLLFGLLFTWPLMWCINYTFAPTLLLALFGVAKITYWKTFVLSAVATSLTARPNYTENTK